MSTVHVGPNGPKRPDKRKISNYEFTWSTLSPWNLLHWIRFLELFSALFATCIIAFVLKQANHPTGNAKIWPEVQKIDRKLGWNLLAYLQVQLFCVYYCE